MGVWTEWRGVLRVNADPQHLGFWCPGCKEMHVFAVPRWQFNGNYDRPTFTPSLKLSMGHHVTGVQLRPDGKCQWCEDAKEDGHESLCGICHLIMTDGQIAFCGDSTHPLAGKTVAMTVRPEREHDG